MLVTRKNIIATALKISKMDADVSEALLLNLLDSNPTIILRALEIGIVKPLFKVVLINHGPNKIGVIKAFRKYWGAGLAGPWIWSEGKPYNDLPSGVWAHNLTKEQAFDALSKVNGLLISTGVKAEILPNDATVNPLPYTWATH
jgi:ribosomal protein L7/L12